MNRSLSWISALLLICGVSAASDPEPSPYITRLSLPDSAKMRIGKGTVYCIAYSPDSKRIAAAGSIGVWIYDAGYGKAIALLRGHTSDVKSAAYSPDGTRIVSASWDGTIRVWDAASDRAEDALLYTLQQGARSAAYSPDGKTIASGGDNAIQLWNAEDGALLNTLEGHTGEIFSVAYSPDSKRIVSGSDDGTARIWSVETGDTLRVLEEHSPDGGGAFRIDSVAYSPDGKTIVGSGGEARIWDADTGGLLHTLGPAFGSVAYSPDGRLVAFSGWYEGRNGIEHGVRIWNGAYGSVRQRFKLDSLGISPSSVAFSPDGHNLAAGTYSRIYIWNIEIGERVRRISGHGSGVDYAMLTRDGRGIAVASFAKPLHIWDPKTGALLKEVQKADGGIGAISPDGKLAADVDIFRDTICVIDVETDSEIHTLSGHTKQITATAFSPDGKTLVSSSRDKTVRLWDVETGAPLHTLHTSWAYSAAYSPDGKTIVSAAGDKTVRIWNAETGQLLKTLRGHTDWVYSAAYSPDGKTIVSAGRDKTARIWNAKTGALLKTLGHTTAVRSAAYSPDGKTIVSGGGDSVRIWNAETGALLKTLEGHTGGVKWVGYLPDGKTLASASDDGTVLIWDVSDLMESGGTD